MPGIGDEGQALAPAQPLQDQGPHALGIMLVIGQQRPADAVAGEQLRADPRILAEDGIHRFQHLEGAQGDIAGIADGGGDDGQALDARLPGAIALARLGAHV